MVEFIQEDIIIDCIESFSEIYKYTNGILVKETSDTIS